MEALSAKPREPPRRYKGAPAQNYITGDFRSGPAICDNPIKRRVNADKYRGRRPATGLPRPHGLRQRAGAGRELLPARKERSAESDRNIQPAFAEDR